MERRSVTVQSWARGSLLNITVAQNAPNDIQFALLASAAGALAGAAAAASGTAAFAPAPVNRSNTERTASLVLRSLTASSRGADAGERRIRLSGSGKIRGSSHGPCTPKGRSNPGPPPPPHATLPTPFTPY